MSNGYNKHIKLTLAIVTLILMICLTGCGADESQSQDLVGKMMTYDIPEEWDEVETTEDGVRIIMEDENKFPYIAIFVDKDSSSDVTVYDDFTDFKNNVTWITSDDKQLVSKRKDCEEVKIDGETAYLACEEYTEKNDSKLKYYRDYEMLKDGFSIMISMETDKKKDLDAFDKFISTIEFK